MIVCIFDLRMFRKRPWLIMIFMGHGHELWRKAHCIWTMGKLALNLDTTLAKALAKALTLGLGLALFELHAVLLVMHKRNDSQTTTYE